MRIVATFALLLIATLSERAAERVAAGEPVAPIRGSLVICGGGELPARVIDEFIKLAGGEKARLVVIPTASERADLLAADVRRTDEFLKLWRDKKPADVALLHARSREEANQEAFVKPLRDATAVWISGGSQQHLADAYLDTAVVRELRALLERGGVIGGTSAGAAILSDPMIAGDPPQGAATPKITRGFGLFPGGLIDQHFTERNRRPRLEAAVAELAKSGNPRFGLGIDERAAVVAQGRELRVIGDNTVFALLPKSATRPAAVVRLREHMRDDLVALHRATSDRAASARAGESFPPAISVRPVVPHGTLVIVGGGGMPKPILDRFLEAAGGKEAKIVVVPTVADPATFAGETRMFTKAGCTNVVVLAPKNRDEANSPEMLAKLRDARGVWFGGGRQWRFVDSFEATKCYDAFHDVLRRGGVIGGSSAGATIQGDYLCRGSPIVNTIMMAEGYERGFAFLPGTAIDQHFTQRKRQPDMESLKQAFPQLLGLGIDEATALVVTGTTAEVVGSHTASFYPPLDPKSDDDASSEVPTPIVLKDGESFDLRTNRPLEKRPAAATP